VSQVTTNIFVCHSQNQNPNVTFYRIFNVSNTTGATSGAENAYPSEAHIGRSYFSTLSFLCSVLMSTRYLFVSFLLTIVLFVLLHFITHDYAFSIYLQFFFNVIINLNVIILCHLYNICTFTHIIITYHLRSYYLY
jgi:hypothetical protein